MKEQIPDQTTKKAVAWNMNDQIPYSETITSDTATTTQTDDNALPTNTEKSWITKKRLIVSGLTLALLTVYLLNSVYTNEQYRYIRELKFPPPVKVTSYAQHKWSGKFLGVCVAIDIQCPIDHNIVYAQYDSSMDENMVLALIDKSFSEQDIKKHSMVSKKEDPHHTAYYVNYIPARVMKGCSYLTLRILEPIPSNKEPRLLRVNCTTRLIT